MKKTFLIVVTLMALMPSASAISGPGDIIPAPVKYVTSGEEYSLKRMGATFGSIWLTGASPRKSRD